ncbi:MAG: M48 family metallopeptidase [Gammaproteobacteria bacterium]|jgi:predicted Zn-dependent protease
MNVRRLYPLLAGILLAMLLLSIEACNLNEGVRAFRNARAALVTPDQDEERLIGHQSAAVLLGASPALNDPQVQEYVNRVGRWVALQSDRPDLPWRFAVLDSPDINAFAAPGGYVFVTRGLLMMLQNEAELAGVLGHEVAHVTRRHHLKAIKKQARLNLLGQAASQILENRSEHAEMLEKIASGARVLYSRGLDKGDEFEADRIGVVLAARAGYDPYGLLAVLQRLQAMKPQDSSVALLFKTHPKPAERIHQLEIRMAGRMDEYGHQAEGRQRYVATLRHLLPAG